MSRISAAAEDGRDFVVVVKDLFSALVSLSADTTNLTNRTSLRQRF